MKFRQRAKKHPIKIGQQQVKKIKNLSPKFTLNVLDAHEMKMFIDVYLTEMARPNCCILCVCIVKEARARQIPVGLPQNLKNYFENALKKPPISNMFG